MITAIGVIGRDQGNILLRLSTPLKPTYSGEGTKTSSFYGVFSLFLFFLINCKTALFNLTKMPWGSSNVGGTKLECLS